MTKKELEELLEKEHQINNKYTYCIVRYKHNGDFDCIWKSGLSLRESAKRCDELNSDYHKNYGIYKVEAC